MAENLRFVYVLARNRSPRTSPRFVSHRDSVTTIQLLNHHDPVHVTNFLCLSDTVRLLRGSAAFRPAFAQCVSRLATISARSSVNSFLSYCVCLRHWFHRTCWINFNMSGCQKATFCGFVSGYGFSRTR